MSTHLLPLLVGARVQSGLEITQRSRKCVSSLGGKSTALKEGEKPCVLIGLEAILNSQRWDCAMCLTGVLRSLSLQIPAEWSWKLAG